MTHSQQLPADIALAVSAILLPHLVEVEQRVDQMRLAVMEAMQARWSDDEVKTLASAVAFELRPSFELMEQRLLGCATCTTTGASGQLEMGTSVVPLPSPRGHHLDDTSFVASKVVADLQPMFAELRQCLGEAPKLEVKASGYDLSPQQQDSIVQPSLILHRMEALENKLLAAIAPVGQAGGWNKARLPSPRNAATGLKMRPRPSELCDLSSVVKDTPSFPPQRFHPETPHSVETAGLTPSSRLAQSLQSRRMDDVLASSSPLYRNAPRHREIATLPPRSFVVNFRRLTLVQKIFDVMHQFISSTAIAALTLVDGGNIELLLTSVVFLVVVLALYAIHNERYDSLDINDFRQLATLLDDDSRYCNDAYIENPNRFLKALAISKSKRRRMRSLIGTGAFTMACMAMWILVALSWFDLESENIVQFMGDSDTEHHMHRITLLLVVSLMLSFHLSFEWLYWRETQCVMHAWDNVQQVPWDVKTHGLPRSHRWLGLPSMWFTSREAYRDLRLWITLARMPYKSSIVSKMFPEEMALLALDGVGASALRHSLLRAKLYDVGSDQFLTRMRSISKRPEPVLKDEEPEELLLELVLFDSSTNRYFQPAEEARQRLLNMMDCMQPPSETVRRMIRCMTKKNVTDTLDAQVEI